MALIVWEERLETGHAAIDEQHRSLVEILNRLHLAMKQGKGKPELEGILVFLMDYTVSHFAMEEGLMERYHYSRADPHRDLHAGLMAQVAELVVRYQAGSAPLTLEIMNFLEDWLVAHILAEDMALAREIMGPAQY